jgi:hypothetical protein
MKSGDIERWKSYDSVERLQRRDPGGVYGDRVGWFIVDLYCGTASDLGHFGWLVRPSSQYGKFAVCCTVFSYGRSGRRGPI